MLKNSDKEFFLKKSILGLHRMDLSPKAMSVLSHIYDIYGNKPIPHFSLGSTSYREFLDYRRKWITSGGFIIESLFLRRESVKMFRIFNPYLEIGTFETEINNDLILLQEMGLLKISKSHHQIDNFCKRVTCEPIDRKVKK